MPPKGRGRGAQARGKGRDGRGANSTNSNQGNGKGTKYRIIGAADSVKTGTEKTVLLQVSNEDGEGHFGQAMGMCLANKEVRGVLHAICKAKFPNVIEHGDQNNTDLLSSDLLKILASSNGLASLTSGASALTNPNSLPTNASNLDLATLISTLQSTNKKSAPSPKKPSSSTSSPAPGANAPPGVCKLDIDIVASMLKNNTILPADAQAWCDAGSFSLKTLYQHSARLMNTPRRNTNTPGSARNVSWAAGDDGSSPFPGTGTASGYTPGSASRSTPGDYAYNPSTELEEMLGFDPEPICAKGAAAAKEKERENRKINVIVTRVFMRSGGSGIQTNLVGAYVDKWHAELPGFTSLADAKTVLSKGSADTDFVRLLHSCGAHFLKRNPDCVQLQSTPSSSSRGRGRVRGKRARAPASGRGASKANTVGGSAKGKKDARGRSGDGLFPPDASSSGSPAIDLRGSSGIDGVRDLPAAQTDSLQGQSSAYGSGFSFGGGGDAGDEAQNVVSVWQSPLCDCPSLSIFPSDPLSLYPTPIVFTIPFSNWKHMTSANESKGTKRLMHVIHCTIRTGSITLEQIVWYTTTAIRGSSHILSPIPLHRHPTHHGVNYPDSLSPHHLYRWYVLLSEIVLHMVTTYGPTDPRAMCVCVVKTRISLCILRYRAKKSHTRSCNCVDSLLSYMHAFDGMIINRLPRDTAINALYIKYSVYNGYCYIGETSTTNRFYDHMRMMFTPNPRQQRVHIVMGRLGIELHDTLIVNFGHSFDRLAFETTLIRQYSHMGKYLLNVRQRCNMRPDTKNLQTKRALSIQEQERARPLNKHQRLHIRSTFYRPYITTRTTTSRIQPSKIPLVILFGGGIGGVTDGFGRTGKYDLRVVYEYDLYACQSHRARFPSIPVVQLELGGDIPHFISTLVRYLHRNEWSKCVIQASPPCRLLSTANKNHTNRNDAMRLVDWTLAVIDIISPAAYIVENVIGMIDLLHEHDKLHRFHHVFDLSYYVPQRRMRAIISNFPLKSCITPLSDTPLPACDVLPTTPLHHGIMNRYGYTTHLREPSVTVVGAGIYMYDTRTHERWPMPIKNAQVLQGFAYNMDVTRYVTSAKRQRLAIGDAVPPPFIYACGLACCDFVNKHVSTNITPCTTTYPGFAPKYYAIVDTRYHFIPTTDLASLILNECADDNWRLIHCTHGTTDIHIHTRSSVARLVGECIMFIDGIIDRPTLAVGFRALSLGRCDYLAVHSARRSNTIPACMMSVFHTISTLAPRWEQYTRRMRLFNLLRSYTYSELHSLYSMSKLIDDNKVRARVRCCLTRYCTFRFHVHPSPVFSMSIPACFGIQRSILTRIIWCIIRKLHLPLALIRDIHDSITYSYSANPSVRDILCNSSPPRVHIASDGI